MMNRLLSVFLLALSCTAVAQDNLPPPFPRPNATKLLENDRIVIWNIVWPDGEPTALHRHVYDQVGTYYARGGRTITQADGTSRTTTTDVGAISTTRKGTTHIEAGNTDPALRAVFIELKRDLPAAPMGAAVGVPYKSDSGGLEWRGSYGEPRVSVFDVRGRPLANFAVGGAPGGTVLVFLDKGKARRTDGKGKPEDEAVEPGTMRYIAPGRQEDYTWLEGNLWLKLFDIN